MCAALLFEPAFAQTNENDDCPGADEVASLGPTTNDLREAFEVTGDSFRVSYDVTFEDPDDLNDFTVDIEDEFGLVESDSVSADDSRTFFVPEGPGNFEVVTDVEPDTGATYTLTVEDCVGNGDGNDNVSGDDNDTNGDDIINVPDKPLPNTGGAAPSSLVGVLAYGSVFLLIPMLCITLIFLAERFKDSRGS